VLLSCTVIVCTRNRPRLLDRSLSALSRVAYAPFDVLVVDNAPTNAAAREVAERHGARYVVEPVPGLSRARNRGVRASTSDIVAFTDDDCVPDPGWLAALLDPFGDSRVMAVGGQIRSLNDPGPVPDDQSRVVDNATPRWFELTNFGGIGDGANMAFRRSVFDGWSGFDERLGLGAIIPGFEEHYAFFSIVERGFRAVRVPTAIVYHEEPATEALRASRRLLNSRAIAAYVFFLLGAHIEHSPATILLALRALVRRRGWRPPATRIPVARPSPARFALACAQGSLLALRALTAARDGAPTSRDSR
jgi:O-antigen biosynthesis protein